MGYYLNVIELAAFLKVKKGQKSLEEIATEAKVSTSTLCRVINHSYPDIKTFFNLCVWLGLHPNHFINNSSEHYEQAKFSKDEEIEYLLRTSAYDKEFTEGIISILSAYRQKVI